MTCHSCTNPITEDTNYCANCGASVRIGKQHKRSRHLNLIIAFYSAELIFLTVAHLVYNDDVSLRTEITIESISAMLVLIFVFLDVKDIISLYTLPKLRPLEWMGMLLAPLLTGVVVYYGIEWINAVLFDEQTNYYASYANYEHPYLLAFIFVAILPPIFEELAYRGFLFNQLEKIASVRVTILIAYRFSFCIGAFFFYFASMDLPIRTFTGIP